MLQQFARVPGDSAATYPNAVPALRRCASTRPSTTLTCASTCAAHAATSSILAVAAVSLLLSSTKQATRHGRLKLHLCHSPSPAARHARRSVTHRHSRCRPDRIITPAVNHSVRGG